MKVKCIANTGENLLEKTISSGELRRTVYPLDIDREYVVYGISAWREGLYYLIDFTEWYPAELFEVVNPLFPTNWYFDFRKSLYFDLEKNKECEIREGIWGYKELVLDFEHKVNLLQGEPEDVEIFQRRKKEIDEFEKMSEI